MSRFVRFVLVGAVSVFAAFSLASSAVANGSGGDFIVKCEFNCDSALAPIENPLGGPNFDFDIALKATSDDLSIRILTEGSVYIVGDIRATGEVKLMAPEFYIDADIFAERVRIMGGNFDPIDLDTPSVLTSADVDLGSGFMSSDAMITAFGSDLDIIDDWAGDGTKSSAETTYVKISAEGDVYIDVSMVKLSRLYVKSGGPIVLTQEPGMMIPEPTTALLLGLGLVGLAAPRLRTRD